MISVDRLVDDAIGAVQLRRSRDAIELLRRALSEDADHARAHAVLALALLDEQRHRAAMLEARRSLALDGGSPYGHYAMAAVLAAGPARQLDEAWRCCQVALLHPIDRETDAAVAVLAASLCDRRGERAEARALLEELLDDTARPSRQRSVELDARVALARIELADGRLERAAHHIGRAFASSRTHVATHVVAGEHALRRDDLDAATRHARDALARKPRDRDAVRLWIAIRGRRQPLAEPGWWLLGKLGMYCWDDPRITVALWVFPLAQLLAIFGNKLGMPQLQLPITVLAIAACAFVWSTPSLIGTLIERDLGAR